MLENKSDYDFIQVDHEKIDGQIFPNLYPERKSFPLSHQNIIALNEAIRERSDCYSTTGIDKKALVVFDKNVLNISEPNPVMSDDKIWWGTCFMNIWGYYKNDVWIKDGYGFGSRTHQGEYNNTDINSFFPNMFYENGDESELHQQIDFDIENTRIIPRTRCLNLLEPAWRDIKGLNRMRGDYLLFVCAFGEGSTRTYIRTNTRTGERTREQFNISGQYITHLASYSFYKRNDITYEDYIETPQIDIICYSKSSVKYIDNIHLYPIWNFNRYTQTVGHSLVGDYDTASKVATYTTPQTITYSSGERYNDVYGVWHYSGVPFSSDYAQRAGSRFIGLSDCFYRPFLQGNNLVCDLKFNTDVHCFDD